MSNALDEIINCDIDLSGNGAEAASFGSILIVVPAPAHKDEEQEFLPTDKPFLVTNADDLLEYGFTEGDAAYAAVQIATMQETHTDELYICVRKPVETITGTLRFANEEVSFYGVHLSTFDASEDVDGAIKWVESNEKLLAIEYIDYENPIIANDMARTYVMFSGLADGYEKDDQPLENRFAALALMAQCFGLVPGSETFANKTLKGITPSKLNANQRKELKAQNINFYHRYAGKNITVGGVVAAGEYIDVIRFRDWLKANLQVAGFNAITKDAKTPFTNGGIGTVENALVAVFEQGVANGGIAEDSLDEEENVVPGYELNMPNANSFSSEDRQKRVLKGVTFSARLAGAIHAVEIHGKLSA